MHAVVVTTNIHDFEKGRAFLTEEIVPRVSQAPGFVGGYWVRVRENQGRSVIVFESEEAARRMADQIQSPQIQSPPDEAVTLDSVDVGEVVAHA
jgi:hypothetical protein